MWARTLFKKVMFLMPLLFEGKSLVDSITFSAQKVKGTCGPHLYLHRTDSEFGVCIILFLPYSSSASNGVHMDFHGVLYPFHFVSRTAADLVVFFGFVWQDIHRFLRFPASIYLFQDYLYWFAHLCNMGLSTSPAFFFRGVFLG